MIWWYMMYHIDIIYLYGRRYSLYIVVRVVAPCGRWRPFCISRVVEDLPVIRWARAIVTTPHKRVVKKIGRFCPNKLLVILSQRLTIGQRTIRIGRLCLTLVMFSIWFFIVCSVRFIFWLYFLREYCCIWHFEFWIFDLDIAFEIRLELKKMTFGLKTITFGLN